METIVYCRQIAFLYKQLPFQAKLKRGKQDSFWPIKAPV